MRIKLDEKTTANVKTMNDLIQNMDDVKAMLQQMERALIDLQTETLLAAGYT